MTPSHELRTHELRTENSAQLCSPSAWPRHQPETRGRGTAIREGPAHGAPRPASIAMPARIRDRRRPVHAHPLDSVIGTVFLLCRLAQSIAGAAVNDEQRVRWLQTPIGREEHLVSVGFWSRSHPNRQSGLLAVASMTIRSASCVNPAHRSRGGWVRHIARPASKADARWARPRQNRSTAVVSALF